MNDRTSNPGEAGLTAAEQSDLRALERDFAGWHVQVATGLPSLRWNAQRKQTTAWDLGVGGVRTLNAADAVGLRWMLVRTAVWDAEVAADCPPPAQSPLGRVAAERLTELACILRGLRVGVEASDVSVLVTNPDDRGKQVRIVCRPRLVDAGQLWFFDAWGRALAEADHVQDAVTEIRRLLAGTAARS
ncbi:hypothetical protein [Actinomadura rupiterrae]|uniref:hypothetical protein n=1 Tax=Actinomadura rupiterrae TaxID=559627 RepID=UPI0020A27C02|nr:hypothetical protein [Actinomadura rupiterrae]MCP2336129.1 hypothetical protein [Actinomadura rupiterrae]